VAKADEVGRGVAVAGGDQARFHQSRNDLADVLAPLDPPEAKRRDRVGAVAVTKQRVLADRAAQRGGIEIASKFRRSSRARTRSDD
jgi:hypothetical protein